MGATIEILSHRHGIDWEMPMLHGI